VAHVDERVALCRSLAGARRKPRARNRTRALPRAAARCGVPFVSLNHQHFLVTSDFSDFPADVRLSAAWQGCVVDQFYSGQAATIVSSFCFPKLRRGRGRVVQIGSLLRPQVLTAQSEHGSHLVAYVRKFASDRFIGELGGAGREVRVYGLGRRPSCGNVRFFDIDERRFIEDLATSAALITTAGNQLLGEALYLVKPILALPEPNNAEQRIHGHLLAREGTGEQHDFDRVSAADLRRFLDRVDEYRSRIARERLNGNPAAVAELRRFLPARLEAARAEPEAAVR
jgi:uncharacterized protein (TIGR00661 family)